MPAAGHRRSSQACSPLRAAAGSPGSADGDAVVDIRAAAAHEPDARRQGDDDRIGDQRLVTVEIVGNFLDVLADLRPLVATEFPEIIPAGPGDISYLHDLPSRQ